MEGVEGRKNERAFYERIIRRAKRVREQAADSLRLERKGIESGWKTEYLFSLTPRRLEEFSEMCHYHQTSPQSPFTRKRVCSRAMPDGRITLSEMKLITTRNGHRDERLLKSDDEWRAALRDHFRVQVPEFV